MAQDRNLTQKIVAEFVGTLALIFVGVMVLSHGRAELSGVALAHGLTIAVMVSATMMISGGHLNPAVTAGVWAGGKIGGRNAVAYILAQMAGGAAGGLLAKICLGGTATGMGVPALGEYANDTGVTWGAGILIEAILTFFLVFVVYGTGIDTRFGGRIGGLAIGFTVALDILAGGPLTGAAMNPARWFGAALAAQQWRDMIVWTAGPVLGGLAAGLLYSRVLATDRNETPAAKGT